MKWSSVLDGIAIAFGVVVGFLVLLMGFAFVYWVTGG